MKKNFSHALRDKIVRLAMSISCVLFLCELAYIVLFYLRLPPYLPIFNQMPWGSSRLGTRIEIFLPLFITAAFFVFNYMLLTKLYEKTPLVSRILSITTLLITTLSCIFLFQTVQLLI